MMQPVKVIYSIFFRDVEVPDCSFLVIQRVANCPQNSLSLTTKASGRDTFNSNLLLSLPYSCSVNHIHSRRTRLKRWHNSCRAWPHQPGIDSATQEAVAFGKTFYFSPHLLSQLSWQLHQHRVDTSWDEINQDLLCGQEQGNVFGVRFHNWQPSRRGRKGKSKRCVPAGPIVQRRNKWSLQCSISSLLFSAVLLCEDAALQQ